MSLLRSTVYIFILKLVLIQLVSSKNVILKDGQITYEYENDRWHMQYEIASSRIFYGIRNGGSEPETRTLSLMYIIKKLLTFLPYIGTRKEVNEPEMVTFKEYSQSKNRTLETNERDVKSETAAYKDIGSHVSIPKFYAYFPETKERKTQVIVTEMIGENLLSLWDRLRPFSTVTVMRIGIVVLDALEYIHKKGYVHGNIQATNLAIGFQDRSKIYVLDFGRSKKINPDKDERENDLVRLARALIEFAQGEIVFGFYDDIDAKVNCRDALKEFYAKALYADPDYEELRNILTTELEKYKNEPDFDKFDWQKL